MNELASLLQIVPYAVLVALLVALLRRLAAWNEGPSLVALVGGPRDLPWPRGVQEEEPVRWDVQRLRRPARRQDTAALPALSPGARPHIDQVCQ